jgi:hypothetical protein
MFSLFESLKRRFFSNTSENINEPSKVEPKSEHSNEPPKVEPKSEHSNDKEVTTGEVTSPIIHNNPKKLILSQEDKINNSPYVFRTIDIIDKSQKNTDNLQFVESPTMLNTAITTDLELQGNREKSGERSSNEVMGIPIDYLSKEYLSQTYDFCKDENTKLNVHVCMLSINNNCSFDGEPLPFLSFLVNYSEQSEINPVLSVDSPILSKNNSIDKVFGFSQFSFQCTHTEDIESRFHNECMKQFLDLVVIETSITDETGEQMKELYKGYVEIGENEIVVIFDISQFQHLPLKSTKTPIWVIEYDILQSSFPISSFTKDFLNTNNYISKVKEIVHSKVNPPKSLYLYNMEKKQYMLRSNKSVWLEARSYDAKYGPFYYFKYMNSRDVTPFITKYRKYAVFMKNTANFFETENVDTDQVIMGHPTPVENTHEGSGESSDDLVLSDSDESVVVKEYTSEMDKSIQQLPFISVISFTRNDELFLCVKTESLFTEIM